MDTNSEILWSSELIALAKCDGKTATSVIKKSGGSYKVAAVCGSSIDELLEGLSLPYEPKFNWTVSGYDSDPEVLEETRISVQSFLKSKSLGKSRFLQSDIESNEVNGHGSFAELKLKELYEEVLFPSGKIPTGFDIVAATVTGGKTLFGYTVGASDVLGFEKRDFSRSYQDPTITIGPRLARVLVNLAMKEQKSTMLDPFCGLGTILQEALVSGYNVVGTDIARNNIIRSNTNLDWIRTNYPAATRLKAKLTRSDVLNLRKENLPKIDGIATEPLLLPKFERNPQSPVAIESVRETLPIYEKSLEVFREILDKGSRIAITAPVVFDDRGREHRLDLSPVFKSLGYTQYRPAGSGEYPIRVPTSKKKIIQRDVYVMTAN